MPNNLITPNIEALLDMPVMYLANIWELTREDGVVVRFTNHNRALEYNGETYGPAGAFDGSAVQLQEGLKEINAEFVGMISADEITDNDLLAGRYRNAVVIERLVDWRWPWRGAILTMKYIMVDTQFTHEQWQAQVSGLTVRLQPAIGLTYSRVCYRKLGDSICRVNLAGLTFTSTVVSITADQRRIFSTAPINIAAHAGVTGAAAQPLENYFRFGELDWTGGDNSGLSTEVKNNSSSGEFALQLPTPFDIQVGDTFEVKPGCEHTPDACKGKFNNIANNGSFQFIPGTTRVNQYPNKPEDEK